MIFPLFIVTNELAAVLAVADSFAELEPQFQ
jgi:hypothetical protein